MSSGKQIKLCDKYEADHLSNLPNQLLVDLISLLPIKEAVRTSVLSRRLRYLWKYTQSINLKVDMNHDQSVDVNFWGDLAKCYVQLVSDLLVTKLNDLQIDFAFANHFQCTIDCLLGFGTERNVEELTLSFSSEYLKYKIPQFLFSAEALTKLELNSCELQMPNSINLPRIKTLEFIDCTFEAFTLQTLVSSCPALQNLHVFLCKFSGHLVFNGANMSFKTLRISSLRFGFPNQNIKIATPSLEYLEIEGPLSVGMYTSMNLVVLHTVRLSFDVDKDFDASWDILKDLHQVKNLELHLQGSQRKFVHELENSSPRQAMKTAHLKLVTSFENPQHLRSICRLMSSFSHLQNLQIDVTCSEDVFDEEEIKWWEHLEYYFSSLLTQLRIVMVKLPVKTPNGIGGGLEPCRILESSFLYSRNHLKLAKILLSNTKTMEKLIITAQWWDDEHFVELQRELLGFDKASAVAEVVIIRGEKRWWSSGIKWRGHGFED